MWGGVAWCEERRPASQPPCVPLWAPLQPVFVKVRVAVLCALFWVAAGLLSWGTAGGVLHVAVHPSSSSFSFARSSPAPLLSLACNPTPPSLLPLAFPSPPVRLSLAQRSAALSLWRGDVGQALQTLLEHNALTADFVSLSAAAGLCVVWDGDGWCWTAFVLLMVLRVVWASRVVGNVCLRWRLWECRGVVLSVMPRGVEQLFGAALQHGICYLATEREALACAFEVTGGALSSMTDQFHHTSALQGV